MVSDQCSELNVLPLTRLMSSMTVWQYGYSFLSGGPGIKLFGFLYKFISAYLHYRKPARLAMRCLYIPQHLLLLQESLGMEIKINIKEPAKNIRAQKHPYGVLFYYRSMDDNSGVAMKRSRVNIRTPLLSRRTTNYSSHS